jgi:hypothetical protein
MKRPASVTTVAVLAIVTGVVLLISSLRYFGVSLVMTPLLFGTFAALTPLVMMGIGLVVLLLGIGAIAVGIGALSLKPWAYSTGLGLFVATVLLGLLQVINGGFAIIGVLNLVLSVVVIAMLFSKSVRSAFEVESGDKFTTQHPSAA